MRDIKEETLEKGANKENHSTSSLSKETGTFLLL